MPRTSIGKRQVRHGIPMAVAWGLGGRRYACTSETFLRPPPAGPPSDGPCSGVVPRCTLLRIRHKRQQRDPCATIHVAQLHAANLSSSNNDEFVYSCVDCARIEPHGRNSNQSIGLVAPVPGTWSCGVTLAQLALLLARPREIGQPRAASSAYRRLLDLATVDWELDETDGQPC